MERNALWAKPALSKFFANYATLHRSLPNRVLHHVGMFFMIWGIIALLDRVPLFTVDGFGVTLVMPLLGVVLGWYLSLDWRIAVAAAVWYVPCIFLGREVALLPTVLATLAGASMQFFGHVLFERMPLKLLKSVKYGMIAPIYFLSQTLCWLGSWRARIR